MNWISIFMHCESSPAPLQNLCIYKLFDLCWISYRLGTDEFTSCILQYSNIFIQDRYTIVVMYDPISLRGERGLWLEFSYKIKRDRKVVWQVLRRFITKYLAADENTRLLLLLVPQDLAGRISAQNDPDEFIKSAILEKLRSHQ